MPVDYSFDLEHFNLIRQLKALPEIEYIFKHALTQEVAYNGLPKREREIIHERIGSVIEQLFQERLPEFYETLAFHFSRSKSLRKAVYYSVKSGDKSLERYALDEAHRNYSQAFEMLKSKRLDSEEEKGLLLEILIKWAFILYYLGDFNSFINLFSAHEKMAESSGDEALRGMYNAWYGFALGMTGNLEESYQKLIKSLKTGEAVGDKKVIGYACTWLVWTCWDSGRLSEAVAFGDRAQAISKEFTSDHYLYFKSLAGIGQTCYSMGKVKKALWVGSTIFDYGIKHSNARSMTLGYICSANGHLIAGDISEAIAYSQKAVDVSRDPFYSHYAKLLLGFCLLMNEEFDQAETALTEVLNYSRRYGANILGVYATAFLGVVYIAVGSSSAGMAMIRKSIRVAEANQRKTVQAILEYVLGKIFAQVATTS
jgi:tetratricopeptide (TPR) repeat protein